jgi:hypothetical protein
MKVPLKDWGIGAVIATKGNWALRHADTKLDFISHSAVLIHDCEVDSDYTHWGIPAQEKKLMCKYCETDAPAVLVSQWFDMTAEENDNG